MKKEGEKEEEEEKEEKKFWNHMIKMMVNMETYESVKCDNLILTEKVTQRSGWWW